MITGWIVNSIWQKKRNRFKNHYYAGPHTCIASRSAAASSGHAQGVKPYSGTLGDPIGYTTARIDMLKIALPVFIANNNT